MGFPSTGVRSLPATHCRLILRQEVGLSEILQFMVSGLEIGQQVVAMAGPACLKDLASHLDGYGLRSSMLLRSGRLVFLTAPECLPSILQPDAALNRGPLHRNGTMMRWLSDWSWAITGGLDLETVRNYQRRVHEFVRSLTAISLCTVNCENLARASLLAMMLDHRRSHKEVFSA